MFTSKSFFSQIICPYQEKCMLPGCIFGHPENQLNGNGSQNGLNLDESQKSGTSRTTLTEPGEILKSPEGEDKPRQRKPSPHEGLSPPPLRRKVLDGTAIPVKHSLSQKGILNLPSSVPTPSSSKPTPKIPTQATPKKESLNPRALKGPAPAKHDLRWKLIQALHEHLKRLNSELAKDANDEVGKLVLSQQQLITMTLDIEEEASYQPSIYSNLVKNKILVYKKMTVGDWKFERHNEVLAKATIAAQSDTPVSESTNPPKPIETGLSLSEELKLLPRLVTPTAGLSKHGYVLNAPIDKEIESAKNGVESAKGWEICDRCKSRFQVFPERREEDGALASGGACTYHYGKPYFQDRNPLDPKAKREKKFRCCGQAMDDSIGCTKAESHVFKISEVKRMASILNFEKTPENPNATDRPVCIDGEMGYTVYGLELIRLTATSWPNYEELFDVLVRPSGPILDLNSRYSGVWPQAMAEAVPWSSDPGCEPSEPGTKRKLRIVESPAAARALLFSHLSPQIPVIGHGLENDLNAARMIHPIIIDTALLYPHKAGLPYRNGLKSLMLTHLNRHVQVVVDGKMDGHDSKEDANAAGDLVRFALANEWQKMKKGGWTLENGEFKAPLGSQKDIQPPPRVLTGPSGKKRSRQQMEEEPEDGEVKE